MVITVATGSNGHISPSNTLHHPYLTNQAEQVRAKALEHKVDGAGAIIKVSGCGFGPFRR